MKIPLRFTVTAAFTVFTAITVALVASLNFIGSRDSIMEAARQDIAASTTLAEQEVKRLVGRAFIAADTISGLPADLFDIRAPEPLLSTLTVALRTSPEIYGVFIGFPDGAFVQAINLRDPNGGVRNVPGMPKEAATAWRVIDPTNGTGTHTEYWRYFLTGGEEIHLSVGQSEKQTTYDPRVRPWFIDAQDVGDTVISKAYVFSSLRQPGVTVARPLHEFPSATVGIDLPLNDLGGLTARLQPGANGVVTILDPEDEVVGYPDLAKIIVNDGSGGRVGIAGAADIDDARITVAAEKALYADASHFAFKLDGRDYIAHVRTIGDNTLAAWRILSVAAIDDFTGGLMSRLQTSLLIAGVVLLVAVLCVAMMAGWITGPVVKLRKMADQITDLNLASVETFDTPFEEIFRLHRSMDRMRSALDMFLRFVPRDVVRQLVRSDQLAEVGGTRREVTLLFTDIEGFTTLSEKMTPEEIMSQTAEYFEMMSLGIQANLGTIDKFIGDAIMAFWNAPSDDPNHVDNACRGVLTAHHIAMDLSEERVKQGKPPMRTRLGLHTCEVLVGNVGARDRMQYTCLGSGVNLAARIEGLNKFYGTQILVSDTVRRRASQGFLFRRVDIVEAKGTTLPLTIYELMGERREDDAFYVGAETVRKASDYEQAFDFYLHRDFADALVLLDRLAAQDPDDPVVAQLREKCRAFADTPPPPEWNGATVLDKK